MCSHILSLRCDSFVHGVFRRSLSQSDIWSFLCQLALQQRPARAEQDDHVAGSNPSAGEESYTPEKMQTPMSPQHVGHRPPLRERCLGGRVPIGTQDNREDGNKCEVSGLPSQMHSRPRRGVLTHTVHPAIADRSEGFPSVFSCFDIILFKKLFYLIIPFFHFFHFSFFDMFFVFFFVLLVFSCFFISPLPPWGAPEPSLKHRSFPQKSKFKGTILGGRRKKKEERRKKKQERADRNRSPSTTARTGPFC